MKRSGRNGFNFFTLYLILIMTSACSKESLQIISSRSGSSPATPTDNNNTSPPTGLSHNYLFSIRDLYAFDSNRNGPATTNSDYYSFTKNSKNELFFIEYENTFNSYILKKSSNSGNSWSIVNTKDFNSDYLNFIFDDSDKMYSWKTYWYSTNSYAIKISEDEGKSWYEFPLDRTALSDCSDIYNIHVLAKTISSVSTLFLNGYCYSNTASNYIWINIKSTDGGITWLRDDPKISSMPINGYNLKGSKIINNTLYLFGSSTGLSYPTVARKNLSVGGSLWEVHTFDSLSSRGVTDLDIDSNNRLVLLIGDSSSGGFNHINVYTYDNSTNPGFSTLGNWTNVTSLETSTHNYNGFYSSSNTYIPLKLILNGSDIYIAGYGYNTSNSYQWFVVRNDGQDSQNIFNYGNALSYNYLKGTLLVQDKLYLLGIYYDNSSIQKNALISLDISNNSIDLSNLAATTHFDVVKYYYGDRTASINSLVSVKNTNTIYGSGYYSNDISSTTYKQMIVKQSLDEGETWSMDYLTSNSFDSEVLASAVASNGDFYIAGYENSGGIKIPKILKRNTQNNYAAQSFSPPGVGTDPMSITAITAVNNNLYFTVSHYNMSSNYTIELYRLSTPSASTTPPEFVKTISYEVGKPIFPTSLHYDSLRSQLIITAYSLSSTGYKWLTIIKSLDPNSAPNFSDSYQLKNGKVSKALAFTVDSEGNYFAAGSARDENDISHMIVRASYDQGLTWSTVEDNTGYDSYNMGAVAHSIMARGPGDLIVSGFAQSGMSGNYGYGFTKNIYVYNKFSEKIDAMPTSYYNQINTSCLSPNGHILFGGTFDNSGGWGRALFIRKGQLQQ